MQMYSILSALFASIPGLPAANNLPLVLTERVPPAAPGNHLIVTPDLGDGYIGSAITLRGMRADNSHGYQIGFIGDYNPLLGPSLSDWLINGYVADVPAFSKQPGAEVQFWPPNGGTNQLWTLITTDGVSFQFVNVNSSLVLDVPASSKQPGTVVQQWTPNGGQNQNWLLEPEPEHVFEFGNIPTSLSCDVEVNTLDQSGFYITIKGGSFPANTTYSVWFMGMPIVPSTTAWQDNDESEVSGHGLTSVTSDGAGNINSAGFMSYASWNGPENNEGYAVVVLEDPQGYITASTTIRRLNRYY